MGGIIGKLSKGIAGEGEVFYPGCKPDRSGSSEGITRIICNPKIVKDGKTYGGESEVVLLVNEDRKVMIEDDGGVPTFVLDRLKKHIKENI